MLSPRLARLPIVGKVHHGGVAEPRGMCAVDAIRIEFGCGVAFIWLC
jgi:hypothetical protein